MADSSANLIAQLQSRLEALEDAGKNASPDNILDTQRAAVALDRAKRTAMQNRLKKDIRSQIAVGAGYDPTGDHPSSDYKEFPCFVTLPDGKKVVAANRYDRDVLLGIVQEEAKPVSVDISNLVQSESAPVTKRKYTKRTAPAPLPANLD